MALTAEARNGNGGASAVKNDRISALQGAAWSAWNESYFAEDRDAYRTAGLSMYQDDMHQRITGLFARLDEQNARLDAALAGRAASSGGSSGGYGNARFEAAEHVIPGFEPSAELVARNPVAPNHGVVFKVK